MQATTGFYSLKYKMLEIRKKSNNLLVILLVLLKKQIVSFELPEKKKTIKITKIF
jgi:hypothetical protein